jgi:hypothetical protein
MAQRQPGWKNIGTIQPQVDIERGVEQSFGDIGCIACCIHERRRTALLPITSAVRADAICGIMGQGATAIG